MSLDGIEAAQLDDMIIERAMYHLEAGGSMGTLHLMNHSPEHDAVTYALRELLNLANRHGIELRRSDVDVDRIAKRLQQIRARNECTRES